MTTISSNYDVSSFNTYSARGGDAALDGIGALAADSDIIGLQETGDPGKHRDAGARVAGAMIEQGLNGYMGPQNGNPIFWQGDRFDLLHAETRLSDDFGAKGETRATNLVVLRDIDTGATLLVSNLHAETSNADGARTRQFNDLETSADALLGEFDIAARIDIGDHNQGLPSELYAGEGYAHNDAHAGTRADTVAGAGDASTQDEGLGGIDHIASKGIDHATALGDRTITGLSQGPSDDPQPANIVRTPVENGDGYQHQMLSSSITVTSDTEANARNAGLSIHGDNGKGAVAYRDSGYNGRAWALGFGNGAFGTGATESGVKYSDINDSVSSVRVSDGASLGLAQNADGSGRTLDVDASMSNVGNNMNDRASSFVFYY
ncbi:MAG: hypothetical protein ACTIJY_06535 [Luteimonas sp.]